MNMNFIHITHIFNALTTYPTHCYRSIDICKWCFSSRTTHNLKETPKSKAQCHLCEQTLILPATSKQRSLLKELAVTGMRSGSSTNDLVLVMSLLLSLSISFWFSPTSHSRFYGSSSKHPLFARGHLINWGVFNGKDVRHEKAVYSTNAQVMRQRRTVLRKTRWKNICKIHHPGKFLNKAFLLVCFHLVG